MTTLQEGFERYLAARAPRDTDRAEVRRYRERIQGVINSEHTLLAFFQSGSFQHGTAVMPYSDVDYVARISFDQRPTSSTTILNNLRSLFEREMWEATSVRVSRPTVTLEFPGLIVHYEVTPAYLSRGTTDEDTVLLIPASGGRWREAAPKAHNGFVADMDRKHGGAVRQVARLLKAWKYLHGVSISSFYLEMRAAEYGRNNDSVFPFTAVRSIASAMVSSGLPAMNDPTGLVSRIDSCSSDTARTSALAKLRGMKKDSDNAHSAWLANDRYSMNQALQAIWGSDFPYCDT